jgi:hypothetical protein
MSAFSGVVLFHGCRPTNADNYLNRGLLVGDRARTDKEMQRLFFGESPTSFELAAYEAASVELQWKYNGQEGKLFTVVDHRVLTHRHGTYLIYGAERGLDIAVRLPKLLRKSTDHYIDLLKRTGRPAVIQVRCTWEQLGDDNTKNIAQKIGARLQKAESENEVVMGDFSIVLSTSIEARYVTVHSFPTEIKDPYDCNSTYRYVDVNP